MRRFVILLIALSGIQILTGCAVSHRSPAHRGRVLELGTDKPIEGAGVLAVYQMTIYYWIERNSEYVGYQAVLTDKEGKFEIPAKYFSVFRSLASFDNNVQITIYKQGYGNFPGSFNERLMKHGKSAPNLVKDILPPEKEVILWLPKLTTEEERREHDRAFPPTLPGDVVLPEGMSRDDFRTTYGVHC